jgi:hypothetical protein
MPSSPNPFASSSSKPRLRVSTAKKVNLGTQGQTPKKIFSIPVYNHSYTHSNPVHIPAHPTVLPSESLSSPDKASLAERPKTSRGKSHPSPDEFYNYVVPSPQSSSEAQTMIVQFTNDTKNSKNNNIPHLNTDTDEDISTLSLEGISRERKANLLACLLIGSMMRV